MEGTIWVPGFSGAKLFLLQTGICFSTSGASVRGMQHLGAVVGELGGLGVGDLVQHPASGTRRGSALMMPSTSVQIQSSVASRAAARMEAEKSEPPRPSVVGRPSAVAPLKPVTTGRMPRLRAAAGGRARAFCAGRLHEGRGVAEDGVGDDDVPGVDGDGAGMPRRSGTRLTSSAESRSPMATASSTERGGRSPSIACR